MKTPDTIEEEVNRIRLQIYEETKDLTSAQYVQRTNRIAAALAKQYGFHFAADAKPLKPEMVSTLTSKESP